MQLKKAALLLAMTVTAGTAHALTMGQVIDSFPQPNCANVLPITPDLMAKPLPQNYMGTYEFGTFDVPAAFRTLSGQPGYSKKLDAFSTQVIEIRPQLQSGGDRSYGGVTVRGPIDGQYVDNGVMSIESQRQYVGGLVRKTDAVFTAPESYYQFDGNLALESTSWSPPLRDMNVKELQYFPQYVPDLRYGGLPGALQETLFMGYLPKGQYYLTTYRYSIGHWFATVNGRQYCGKGLQVRRYSSTGTDVINIQ
ncbi:hypothetical protein ACUHMQ_12300 [Chitinimonas sp. PSY-7]|uniref:hypothetical protein n=1 Tax=Chitinimonas sp. PSY-7 TaxID=3459088 RepID=UPI00403FCA49